MAKIRNGMMPKKRASVMLMTIHIAATAIEMPMKGLNSFFKNNIGLFVTELINSNLSEIH